MSRVNRKELESLADYLSDHQESIIRKWETKTKKQKDNISKLLSLSHHQFRDNIPEFLKALFNYLGTGKENSVESIGEHGQQRWEHGIKLQPVMREWESLHQILIDKISKAYISLNLDSKTYLQAQKMLANMIHKEIISSVNRYSKLEKRQAEVQRRELEKTLMKESKISSKRKNLRHTSHDLKGVLYTLRTGFFLLEDKDIDKDVRDTLRQMSLATDSLTQLVNNLLNLFRLEAGEEELNLTDFNVAEVVKNLCESLQPLATKEQLELICEGEELQVYGDPSKVKRIARNLILNSLKYTMSGEVKIQWQMDREDQWLLQISDTGPGMDSEHLASLTSDERKAYSEKKKVKESDPKAEPSSTDVQNYSEGIGLLVVRQLCELMDAVIEVESKKNIGTKFRIVLPKSLSPN